MLPIPPEEAGFAPDLEARLDKAIAEKRVWNVHGLVVLRHDRLVLERYFEGEDEARGRHERGAQPILQRANRFGLDVEHAARELDQAFFVGGGGLL